MNGLFRGPSHAQNTKSRKVGVNLFSFAMACLFLLSAGPSTATPTHSGNLISDPGFESGSFQLPFDDAHLGTISLDASESLTGSYSLRFSATGNLAYTKPWRSSSAATVTAVSGEETFELSAWVKTDLDDRPVRMFIFCLDDAYNFQTYPFSSQTFVANTNWQKISMNHTCQDGTRFASMRLQVDTAGSTAWWDDLSFTRTAAPGSNLLGNGGFETGELQAPFSSAWNASVHIDSAEALVGQYSLRQTSNGTSSFTKPYRLSPAAAVVALDDAVGTFQFSAWAKADTADTSVKLRLFCLDETYAFNNSELGTGSFVIGTDWEPLTLDYTCSAGARFIGLRLDVFGAGNTVWWDELRLQDDSDLVNALPDPDVESGQLGRPFEGAFQGTLAVDSSVALTGSHSLKLTATHNNDGFTNPWNGSSDAAVVPLTGESTVRFAAWAKADAAAVPVQLRLFCLDEDYSWGGTTEILSETLGSDWQHLILDTTCPAGTSFASVRLDVDENGRSAWWDAMQVAVLASSAPGGGGSGTDSGDGGDGGTSACDHLSSTNLEWARFAPNAGAEGTLLTGDGAPLRGVWWNMDQSTTHPPSEEQVTKVKTFGMNTIHVYAERTGNPSNCIGGEVCCERITHPDGSTSLPDGCYGPAIMSPGYSKEALCELVNEAAAQDVYVMITIGDTGLFDYWEDWVEEFWTLYAPIFADQKNVIFEINNESSVYAPADQLNRRSQKNNLQIIRNVAPEVPVLLFSYAYFDNPAGVQQDLNWIKNNVPGLDKTRTGVAFHGYAQLHDTQASVNIARNTGFAVVETEGTCPIETDPWAPPGCTSPYAPLLEQHENNRTSWMSFQWLATLGEANFRTPIDNEKLIWAADFGNWPGSSNPPTGSTIFLKSPLSNNDHFVSVGSNGVLRVDSPQTTPETRLKVVAMGSYVALWSESAARYVTPGNDGQLEATAVNPYAFEWIDRPDGQVTLQATGSWLFVGADYSPSSPQDPAILWANEVRGGDIWEGFEWGAFPEITLAGIQDGDVLKAGDPVNVSATVDPASTSVQKVDFHYGPTGNLTVSDFSSPFSQSLPSSSQGHNSTWSVYAVAHVDGETFQSEAVTVRFDAQAPSPSITSPADGATVGGPVTIVVDYGGADDISLSQLFVDGVFETSVAGAFPLQWNTSGLAERSYQLEVRVTDAVGHVGSATATVTVDNTVTPSCVPNDTTLCLHDRFAITMEYDIDLDGQKEGDAEPIPFNSNRTGFFSFFGNDNYEAMLKIIDGRCYNPGNGTNDHWWFYYGGLTSLGYKITVTDMDNPTLPSRTYSNLSDPICGGADPQLFSEACPTSNMTTPELPVHSAAAGAPEELLDGPETRWERLALPKGASSNTKAGTCSPGPTTLCLHQDRIEVTVQFQGSNSAEVFEIQGSDVSGLFTFFDPDNVELAVKVIDGDEVNEHWWVFFGVLTDLDYTVTVRDTTPGGAETQKQYSSAGIQTYCGVADDQAIDKPLGS